jgi:predicted kinase
MIHLLCGSTGAGKTVYARRLAAELGGVHFSIDEWMTDLFWPDAPQPIEGGWAMARVERCRARIWSTALAVAQAGTPCLLEIGLTTTVARADFAARAAASGMALRLHYLDVPAEERWRRVERRNRASEGQLDFAIDRAMFDFVEAMWEPPTDAELTSMNGLRIAP